MHSVKRILAKISSSLLFIISVAFVIGIGIGTYAPEVVGEYPHVSLVALAGIFFLSALKIDFHEVRDALGDGKTLLISALFMLVLLPIVVFFVANTLYPEVAIAFLLLSAMPSGMTAPFLTSLAKGSEEYALVMTVITSLLTPLSVPLVVSLMVGTDISIDTFAMFTRLAIIIFLPFFLAQIIKRIIPKTITRIEYSFTPVSTGLLAILIAFIVAKRPEEILALGNGGESLFFLFALTILFIVLHVLGYTAIWWKKKRERIAIAICLTYMNFTLAIDLADTFFGDMSSIVVPTILSVIPWALLFIPFRALIQRKSTAT
ncbi:MAG: bile acid:sodium symporter [Parcubacteria group bacterium]|nr:bile acid:sodium symporter [Parcubacteria group bacterium]